ncbi:MAG: NifB/NifX family molybdenum-iron cluster-binding protein [Hadesarchaea archaeon]|nr:NifB/NifX family molybdenum-iron cluster-binding protein [Hadesarchaea archaeon]
MTKIAVATQEGGLDDQVSPIFGRCQTFTFVEIENNEIKNSEVAQNQYANASGGAGIQAAGFVTQQGVDAVIAGNFGPNVSAVLNKAKAEMVPASDMKVKEAAQNYVNGELSPVSQATAPALKGASGQGGMSGMGAGLSRGMGSGMGRRMMQQPGQQPGQQGGGQPQQGQQQSQGVSSDRVKKLEDRMKNLEKQLNEIQNILRELGKK